MSYAPPSGTAIVFDRTTGGYAPPSGASVNFDAGIGFDAVSNSGSQVAQGSYSWSHTCAGNNRYLRVGVSLLSGVGPYVTAITYNGTALTLVRARTSTTGNVSAEMWELINPDAGTHTIAVTLSGTISSVAAAMSFDGVNQTVATESLVDAEATNVGDADATVDVVTLNDGDWITDVVATNDETIAVDGHNTERANVVASTIGAGGVSTSGPISPVDTETMAWDVSALKSWAIVAASIRPINAAALTVSQSNGCFGM